MNWNQVLRLNESASRRGISEETPEGFDDCKWTTANNYEMSSFVMLTNRRFDFNRAYHEVKSAYGIRSLVGMS